MAKLINISGGSGTAFNVGAISVHITRLGTSRVCSAQVQRARPSILSSRPEPRPSPWTLLWPGSADTAGSHGVALAGISPVAGRSAHLIPNLCP